MACSTSSEPEGSLPEGAQLHLASASAADTRLTQTEDQTRPPSGDRGRTEAPVDQPGPVAAADADGGDEALDESADAELLFAVMLAEMALQSDDIHMALEAYLAASEKSRSTEVTEQAARLAAYADRWDVVDSSARRMLELEPESVEARLLLAAAEQRSGNKRASIDHLLDALERSDDRDATLREWQGAMERYQIPGGDDLTTATAIADAFPDVVSAHAFKTVAAYRSGDRALAEKAVDKALALDPDYPEALQLKFVLLRESERNAEALEVYDRMMVLGGDDGFEQRVYRAELLGMSGRRDDMAAALDELADEATEPEEIRHLANLALREGLRQRAQDWYRQLLDNGQHRHEAHFALATLAEEAGDVKEAMGHYEAVGSSPWLVRARERQASLMADQGNLEGGLALLESLQKEFDNPAQKPHVVESRARLLDEYDRSDEAYEVLSEGIEEFPEATSLLYLRALVSESLGNTAEMESDLTALIEREPENAHALNALGYHYTVENRDLEQAEAMLEKASELLPEDPAVMDSLGWLRFRQARYEESIALLETAYELLPEGEIAAHLGEALWADGQNRRAEAVWRKALENDEEDSHVLDTIERLGVALPEAPASGAAPEDDRSPQDDAVSGETGK